MLRPIYYRLAQESERKSPTFSASLFTICSTGRSRGRDVASSDELDQLRSLGVDVVVVD